MPKSQERVITKIKYALEKQKKRKKRKKKKKGRIKEEWQKKKRNDTKSRTADNEPQSLKP